jgi:hypothetical protein
VKEMTMQLVKHQVMIVTMKMMNLVKEMEEMAVMESNIFYGCIIRKESIILSTTNN